MKDHERRRQRVFRDCPTRCFLQAQGGIKTPGTFMREVHTVSSEQEEEGCAGGGAGGGGALQGCLLCSRKGTWLPREGNNQNRLWCLKTV